MHVRGFSTPRLTSHGVAGVHGNRVAPHHARVRLTDRPSHASSRALEPLQVDARSVVLVRAGTSVEILASPNTGLGIGFLEGDLREAGPEVHDVLGGDSAVHVGSGGGEKGGRGRGDEKLETMLVSCPTLEAMDAARWER